MIIFLGIVVASLYATYTFSMVHIMNADVSSSIYQFRWPLHINDILVADWHTNLLKWPVLIVQSFFPINRLTLTISGAILILLMWVGLLVAVKKISRSTSVTRMFALLALILTACSGHFIQEVSFTTIRNIEFPIFVFMIYSFWRSHQSWVYRIAYITAGALLFASDPFFQYLSLAMLPIVIREGIVQKRDRRYFITNILVLLAPVALAKLSILLAMKVGVFLYFGETLSPITYSFMLLPQAMWSTASSIVGLMGAGGVFGREFSIATPIYIALLVLLCGLIAQYSKYGVRVTKQFFSQQKINPVLYSIFLSSIASVVLYTLFYSMSSQHRYMIYALLCMLIVSAISWKSFAGIKSTLFVSALTVTIVVAGGVLYYSSVYPEKHANYTVNTTGMIHVAKLLDEEKIGIIVAGHSYAYPTKIWMKSYPLIAPILYCNQNLPFLTRLSNYKSTATPPAALIIDRHGRDAHSWTCTDEGLKKYYGSPSRVLEAVGLDGKSVEVWIYNDKTLLDKIKIIETRGTPRPLLNY